MSQVVVPLLLLPPSRVMAKTTLEQQVNPKRKKQKTKGDGLLKRDMDAMVIIIIMLVGVRVD